MTLNRKVKKCLVATLASVSTVALLIATATTVQAKSERTPNHLVTRVAEESAPTRRPAPEVRRPDPGRPVPSRSDRDRPVPTAPEQSVSKRPPVPHR